MSSKNNSQRDKAAELDLRPRISVVGVGGAGGNAVNNMIRSKLEGVDFFAANTDAQALESSLAPEENRIKLGLNVTQGLGAGSKPDVGRAAAEESMEEIIEALQGSNMVFITAGMGGGTGTGAAPVVARASRESGILTIGVVTKPFNFEGAHRSRSAERGIEELQQYVDTLIVIPNQNLFRIANEHTTFADAFKMADNVLYSGVRGVTDLMVMPGLINLDFADIRAVMSEMGKAMMGTGESEGERRALDAAEAAISNPLLDDVSLKGARGVLVNITGGYDMTLYEVDEAATRIRDDVDPDANIIFGSTFDEKLNGRMRVSVVATGIGSMTQQKKVEQNVSTVSSSQVAEKTVVSQQKEQSFSFSSAPVSSFSSNPSVQSFSDPEKEDVVKNPIQQDDFYEEHQDDADELNQEHVATYDIVDEETDVTSVEQSSQEDSSLKKKKTASLFERFTGVARKLQSGHTEEVAVKKTDLSEKDQELLDIPAFLRKGKK